MHEHDQDQPVEVGGLYMDRVPRASLEDEVVQGLRGRGVLQRPNTSRRTRMLQAAAGVVLFLTGWGGGWGTAQIDRSVPVDEQYMLLLWEGPEFEADQSLAEEYGAWGRTVGESGVAVSGEELGSSRQLLGPTNLVAQGAAGATGPPSEYRLGGYFMLGAGEEEALALAENHPHRRHGGWVEVAAVVVR